jgi:tetratricopeptide (TPR) repeat protein
MANRTASTLSFCGRVSELETIKARWRMACNVEDPSPQVVVIKAERGLGKTRLALEFYKWLRENEDGWLTKSYWPDALDIMDRNLDVNPDPGKCKLSDVPIPYLWWGLRAADVGAENGVAADAIATYDRFLAPHLAALFLKSEMIHHGWSLAKAMASVGIDFVATALTIDKFVSVGKGVLKTAEILLGAANKQTLNEAIGRSFSRSDSVLDDLRREFKPGTLTCAKVPGVILIDDAQFIHEDPALPSFVERLMYRSMVERWPLLILVTHWRAELSPELAESASSFAAILKHARHGLATDLSPAYCLPGGYLGADHFTEIDLKPIPDLADALREKLPGLTPEQSTAILADMGGNPRFLEQVIAFLLEHEGLFEGFDTSRGLTAEGLAETLGETRHQEIFRIVLRRLRKAPEDVQEAICLASLQGMTFASNFVDQLADDILSHPVRQSLSKGEDPYSMLVGTKTDSGESVGQFAERLFHLVAEQHRQSLKSLGGEQSLQAALAKKVRKVVDEGDPVTTDSPEALGIVYGIAANLFERSAKSADRLVAQRAIHAMVHLELRRRSLESAAAWWERRLAMQRIEPEADSSREAAWTLIYTQHRERIEILESLALIYRGLHWPGKSARTLRRIVIDVTNLLPGDLNYRLFQMSKAGASEIFDRWKQQNPDASVGLYKWSIEKIVLVLLELSELARALPDLKIAKGDEGFGDTTFFIRVGEVSHSSGHHDSRPQHELRSYVLQEMAYAQDGVLGEGEAEKKHFWLLEREGRSAMNQGQFETAEGIFLRALKLNEALGDDLFQLSTLHNLAATCGGKGDVEGQKAYLEQASPLVNSYINEPKFAVDEVIGDGGSGGGRMVVRRTRVELQPDDIWSVNHDTGARGTRRVYVPLRLSKAFDENPDDVLGRNWLVMQTIACLFYTNGNLALAEQDFIMAKEQALTALDIRVQIGDPEGAFHDLGMLVKIARAVGDHEATCSYLRRTLDVVRTLQQTHLDRWDGVDQQIKDDMREDGCPD